MTYGSFTPWDPTQQLSLSPGDIDQLAVLLKRLVRADASAAVPTENGPALPEQVYPQTLN